MRVAYADPPYMRKGRQGHYQTHPESTVYDSIDGHAELVERLVADFPDGWALSLPSTQLRDVLPLTPDDARVLAWVKPYTTFWPNVSIAYAWEPVIVRGGRKRPRDEPTLLDWISAPSPAQQGRGFVGRKPLAFCLWMFSALGLSASDELVDLFPGSGAVADAWARYGAQIRVFS